MPGRNGLVSPPDEGYAADISDLDCEIQPCNRRAYCKYQGLLYCQNCLASEFSAELYEIESDFLSGKTPPACTYAVICDRESDEDEAVAIEIKFSLLNTVNGGLKCSPIKVSLKKLEEMKTKGESNG